MWARKFCNRLHLLLFPHDFTDVNAWGRCFTPICYSIYRALILILSAVDFAFIAYSYRSQDLVFFTHWGIIMTIACFLVLFLQNICNYCVRNCSSLKYWKIAHFFFTNTLIFQMFINGAYWCVIYPVAITQKYWGPQDPADIAHSIMAHAVPLALLFIDLQINLIVVWNFMYLPFYLILLICYLIVNCIYTLQVEIIYQMVTYKTWLTYVVIIGCFLAVILCHILARIFCKFFKEEHIIKIVNDQQKIRIKSSLDYLRSTSRPSKLNSNSSSYGSTSVLI